MTEGESTDQIHGGLPPDPLEGRANMRVNEDGTLGNPDTPTTMPNSIGEGDDPSPELIARIKNDVLEQARKDAETGSKYSVLHGFYDRDHKRYARVSSGDVETPSHEQEDGYDENLTPQETDEIRGALYAELGATPPTDDEFERQKKPTRSISENFAEVVTPTDRPGISVAEVREWRVLSEDVARKFDRDILDFTAWGIAIRATDRARNVKVDEVIPHFPGVNSAEGDTPYIDEDSEVTEKDESTALYMAEAGDEKRTEAASKRRTLRRADEYHEALLKARGRTPFGRRNRLMEVQMDYRHDDLFSDKEGRRLMAAASGDLMPGSLQTEGEFARIREELRNEARIADEIAERQEGWAKALHEHPVSEAYKQAHPNIKFGPHSLSLIESWLPKDKEIFESWRKQADEDIKAGISKASLGNWTGDVLDSMEYEKAPEEVVAGFDSRLEKLDSSQSSTWGEYQELYRDAMRALAGQQEKNFNERTQVLDDVRSGRASDPDYQAPQPEGTFSQQEWEEQQRTAWSN